MLAELQETPGYKSYLAGELDFSRRLLEERRFGASETADCMVSLKDPEAFKYHIRDALAHIVGRFIVNSARIKECKDRPYGRGVVYEVQGVFLTLEEAQRINAALRLAAEVAERFAYK